MKKQFKAYKPPARVFCPVLPFNLDPFKRKGKHLKCAKMLMPYGASIGKIVASTSLSLRRVKVLHKQYFGSPRARVLSSHLPIC